MSQIEEPFQNLLENLARSDVPLRAEVIYRLSVPGDGDMALLTARWPDIPVERKQVLLARMVEASELNFELDFSEVARFTAHDPDPEVRIQSINALWTSEQPEVMYQLIELLRQDPVTGVRAAAADGLGQFVLLGELGHLPSSVSGDAERELLEVVHKETLGSEVYRRALESLAYSSHHDITDLIASVSKLQDANLRASTILAMGRNADNRWNPIVQEALTDSDPLVRFEAVRAAGEMSLADAVSEIIPIAADTSDREIQDMAIWSLGEIGGDEARSALLALAETTTDETLLEAIEDATNMAVLSLGDFGMYVMAPEDDDDELMLEDLEGLDDDSDGPDAP